MNEFIKYDYGLLRGGAERPFDLFVWELIIYNFVIML
jgi:hypothetical protein